MTHKLPPFKNGRIDFHDNGTKPGRGKTRFGLVIDLNGSKERWNINFQVMPIADFAALMTSPNLTTAQQQTIQKVCEVCVAYGENKNVFIAPAKRNVNAGKAAYRLEYDYSVAALIDTSDPEDPVVLIQWGDEQYVFDDFYVPATSNHSIKGRVDV